MQQHPRDWIYRSCAGSADSPLWGHCSTISSLANRRDDACLNYHIAILVLTVVYAIIGFIAGAILAVIYILAAGIFVRPEIKLTNAITQPEKPDGDHVTAVTNNQC